MSETPTPVKGLGSICEGLRTSGHGRGRTRGGKDSRGQGREAGRHHQYKC